MGKGRFRYDLFLSFKSMLTRCICVDLMTITYHSSLQLQAFARNCSELGGSGSHENAGPFTVVAMEKEAQTSIMHKQRFGERKRLANKTSQTLSQRVIPALHMCRFSCFLSYRCMVLFWNHCLVGFPKVGVAMPCTIGLRNGFPQCAAGFFASISYCICHHLSRLSTQRYPDPRLLRLLQHQ